MISEINPFMHIWCKEKDLYLAEQIRKYSGLNIK
jgi:hypothetical protein